MTDFSKISPSDETRGWAHANRVFGFALLQQMLRKGILTEEEVHQVLDLSLSALEGTQMSHPGDQSLLVARDVLGGMMEFLCPQKRPQ